MNSQNSKNLTTKLTILYSYTVIRTKCVNSLLRHDCLQFVTETVIGFTSLMNSRSIRIAFR